MNTPEATKPSNDPVIQLTKIKQWFIPVDAEAYLTLKKAGAPMTRIHQDFLPLIGHALRARGIRAKKVEFKASILDPFLDKVGTTWNKKPHSTCTIQAKSMKFETTHADGLSKAREAVPKLQDVLTTFFNRWGYRTTFEYSEVKGKVRLNVEYWFDPEKQPIVVLAEEPQEKQKIQLKLGNLRLSFVFDSFESKTEIAARPVESPNDERPPKNYRIGYVHTIIESSQGGKFNPIYSSRCKYSEISNVMPLVAALMDVPNHNETNFDEPAD